MLSAEYPSSSIRRDVARQAVTVVGGIAQVVLPALLLPRSRRSAPPPDVVQPAPWTFAVWLPVYAASLVHVVDQARPGRRDDPVLRAAGWPLAGAYAALGVWAPLVVRGRYWAAQGALLAASAAAGVARRRVARAEQDRGVAAVRTVLVPAAALSAWGTAAAGVNLAAMVAAYGPVPGARGRTGLALTTLAALSGAASTAVARSGPPTVTTRIYGSVVLWALNGIVAGRFRRDRVAAAAAGLAAVPVLAALVRRTPMTTRPVRTGGS
jgi:hypothetical protein